MAQFVRVVALAGLWIVLIAHQLRAFEQPRAATSDRPAPLNADRADAVPWRTDYRAALAEARQRRAMVLLWFIDPERPDENEALESKLFRHRDVSALLDRVVPVKLSEDAAISLQPADDPRTTTTDHPQTEIRQLRLLDHPAFEEMLGQTGVALIDLRDAASPHFHEVVSVLPFGDRRITPRQLAALLDLPDGSLTQRTLIWAVRTHPESPQSASCEASPLLMHEAASHAAYQASLGTGGHHQWDERFHRINQRLPDGLLAQEICAESWPGQPLVAAAEECVHSWRQSRGHWDAVRTLHPLFGYDMRRSAGGIWFAAGIFGRKH